MGYFWAKGPMLVRELLDLVDEEPKPHYNTLSTIVRSLEAKGYLGYKAYGKTYQYYARVSEEEYRRNTLRQVVDKYFDKSYTRVVSSLANAVRRKKPCPFFPNPQPGVPTTPAPANSASKNCQLSSYPGQRNHTYGEFLPPVYQMFRLSMQSEISFALRRYTERFCAICFSPSSVNTAAAPRWTM